MIPDPDADPGFFQHIFQLSVIISFPWYPASGPRTPGPPRKSKWKQDSEAEKRSQSRSFWLQNSTVIPGGKMRASAWCTNRGCILVELGLEWTRSGHRKSETIERIGESIGTEEQQR